MYIIISDQDICDELASDDDLYETSRQIFVQLPFPKAKKVETCEEVSYESFLEELSNRNEGLDSSRRSVTVNENAESGQSDAQEDLQIHVGEDSESGLEDAEVGHRAMKEGTEGGQKDPEVGNRTVKEFAEGGKEDPEVGHTSVKEGAQGGKVDPEVGHRAVKEAAEGGQEDPEDGQEDPEVGNTNVKEGVGSDRDDAAEDPGSRYGDLKEDTEKGQGHLQQDTESTSPGQQLLNFAAVGGQVSFFKREPISLACASLAYDSIQNQNQDTMLQNILQAVSDSKSNYHFLCNIPLR